MKVEHIGNDDEAGFYKRLSKFLADETKEITGVHYATSPMPMPDYPNVNTSPILYSALVLYEDKEPVSGGLLEKYLKLDSEHETLKKAHEKLKDSFADLMDAYTIRGNTVETLKRDLNELKS